MTLLPLRLLLALTLAVGLGSCGDPDPEQAADDLASMKSAVDSEVRDMAGVLSDSGLSLERAKGRVESEGMSTYRAEDYKASAVVVGEGAEGEQVDRAATALEEAGWTRTADGLDASEPWAQLERDDFRTTIGWTKVGERELVLSLDQEGEVEVPSDTDPVERDNSVDIPLD
ncbi:hypothetical protein [Nocardioides sp. zg-1228]|uniref:hypothetical protein n=1 Tax=Nocardioides sp. zg-1228 TaxID=2763008 RepID=UPI0016430393|nr:hypothetical protein [Nocardioides sp. zg-1228]MBC2931628.1 hypothetical protein [Nocardioides sp. zg-1228]QSF57221.1 hypothetical protein JX575_16925 [Nocardioides sp. zg-1228]